MMDIIHFTANWCNPCKQIKPVVDSFVELHPEINYTMVDIDQHPEKAKDLGVLSIPTLLFVRKDQVVSHRHIGLISTEQLNSYIS